MASEDILRREIDYQALSKLEEKLGGISRVTRFRNFAEQYGIRTNKELIDTYQRTKQKMEERGFWIQQRPELFLYSYKGLAAKDVGRKSAEIVIEYLKSLGVEL